MIIIQWMQELHLHHVSELSSEPTTLVNTNHQH